MEVDPFLCVGMAILIFIGLVVNVYILAYWQHPEDKNQSYFAKCLIILGLQLGMFSVLLLPVDVANNAGSPGCDTSVQGLGQVYCGGINMFLTWECLFCMICFIVIGLIPFTSMFYEAGIGLELEDGPTNANQSWIFLSSLVFSLVLFVPIFLYFGETSLPVSKVEFAISELTTTTIFPNGASDPYQFVDQHIPLSEFKHYNEIGATPVIDSWIKYRVNFPVYIAALFGWIGWWFFSIFTGVGLTVLPFELVYSFLRRPRILAPDELAALELELQDRTNEILDLTTMLKKDRQLFLESMPSSREKNNRRSTDQLEANRLTKMVYVLERDVADFQACKNIRKGYNPLVPYFNLIAGSFLASVSFLWFLHIILYMLPTIPQTLFLNAFLLSFDTWFPMFGNMSYALLSLYLLCCTVKGCFKLGMQLVCIRIHPMEVGATYVNSFLFNIGLVLVCTIPCVHFCVLALAGYTRASDAFLIFNVQVRYLPFYTIFFDNKVFTWMILLGSCISLPYLVWRPRETALSTDQFKESLTNRSENTPNTSNRGGFTILFGKDD